MTNEEMGEALYGADREPKSFAPAKPPPEMKPMEREPPVTGPRSNEELGEALYGPAQDENYAKIDGQGNLENIVRDVDGRIRFRSFDNSRESQISTNPKALVNSDLRGMIIPDIPDGDLRGADLRGATLKDVRGCDLRGAILDGTTDISGADFDRTTLDTETFDELAKCRGFKQARRLARPLRSGE